MPMIGWIFVVLAAGLILGNLMLLRTQGRKPISREKMDRIRKRKQELEAEEKDGNQY